VVCTDVIKEELIYVLDIFKKLKKEVFFVDAIDVFLLFIKLFFLRLQLSLFVKIEKT
jgi:hypothetical protein